MPSERLEKVQASEPSPARVAIGRVLVDRVWAMLTVDERWVWWLLVMEGRKGGIARRAYRAHGWSAKQVWRRRARLRQVAAHVGAMSGWRDIADAHLTSTNSRAWSGAPLAPPPLGATDSAVRSSG